MSHPDGPTPWLTVGWRTAFVFGLITVALGAIIVARPTQSLTVIAVLLGVAMIVSGVFQIVRAFDGRDSDERVWRGISGTVFILAGLALLRHLHLSVTLIGLFIGFTWVIQGIAALVEAAAGRHRQGSERGWTLFFGVISLIAGIVVIAAPIASVAALTLFMGIWLIVMGGMEIIGSLVFRHALRRARKAGPEVSVPGQRATKAEAGAEEKRAGHTAHE